MNTGANLFAKRSPVFRVEWAGRRTPPPAAAIRSPNGPARWSPPTPGTASRKPGGPVSSTAAKNSARAIRDHWGDGEIRNHWVRDARWAADRTRAKNWQFNANLAVPRAGLIARRAERAAHRRWPVRFELAAHQPAFLFRLVPKSAPK